MVLVVVEPVHVAVFVMVEVGTPTSTIAVPPGDAARVVVNGILPLVTVTVSVGTGTSISTTTVPSEVYVEVFVDVPVHVAVLVIVEVGTSTTMTYVPSRV